jgi:phage terminase large subunit-like protein
MIAPIALYETARKGNEVYCAANALPQASIIWTEASNMLKQSTQLKQILRPMQYSIKNIRPNGFSKFMPLANSPNILDGKLPHVVILDEIHELQQALYNILYDGQISLRDPLLFMLTTRGYVREGLFDAEYEDSCKIIDGVYSDERKFSLLYELDNPADWLNEDNWIQANPSLGYILQIDALRDKVASEINKPKSLNSFKTKQFNIGGISGDAYFEYDVINNTRTFNIEKFRRYQAIGGFDLSLTNDLTAFTTLIWDEKEGEYCVDTMFWISEDFYVKALQDKKMADTWRVWVDEGYVAIAGKNSIDYSKIVDYAIFIAEKYEIIYKYIYYDAYSARYLVNAFDCAGFREDVCLKRCRQGSQTLSVPFQQLDADLRAKKVNYNNNPIMKWCLTNVAVEEDTRNKNLLPCKAGHNEKRKIDGFATLLDAYVGLVEHYSEFVG